MLPESAQQDLNLPLWAICSAQYQNPDTGCANPSKALPHGFGQGKLYISGFRCDLDKVQGRQVLDFLHALEGYLAGPLHNEPPVHSSSSTPVRRHLTQPAGDGGEVGYLRAGKLSTQLCASSATIVAQGQKGDCLGLDLGWCAHGNDYKPPRVQGA